MSKKWLILIIALTFLSSCHKPNNQSHDSLTFNKIDLADNNKTIIKDNMVSKYEVDHATYQLLDINKHQLTFDEFGSLFNKHLYLLKNHSYSLGFKLNTDNQTQVSIKKANHTIFSKTVKQGTHQFNFNNTVTDGYFTLEFLFTQNNKAILEDIMLECLTCKDINLRVNQLGYQPQTSKVFLATNYYGDYFSILDYETNKVVKKYRFNNKLDASLAQEIQYFGDFSDFKQVGKYYLKTEFGAISYPFEIKDDLYVELYHDSLKMIKGQRCFASLDEREFGLFSHGMCHTSEALLWPVIDYESEIYLNVFGGWHDAGDYGRYSQTIIKVMHDLILSYHFKPSEALYDEIKWGLNFLMNMQDPESGGVYLKIVSKNFSNFVYPDKDHSKLYVFRPQTNVSASSALVFSLCSEIFKENQELSQELKERALKAKQYAFNNYYKVYDNTGFDAGHYSDPNDYDDRFNSLVGLYLLEPSNDNYIELLKYLKGYTKELTFGFGYEYSDAYGAIFYLLKHHNQDNELTNLMRERFMTKADKIYNNSFRNPYYIADNDLIWGSNYRLLDEAKHLYLAGFLTNKDQYAKMALMNLNYVLGQNALNMSFISGYGHKYPLNIHHRISVINNHLKLKGALVGGVNFLYEDPITQKTFNNDTIKMRRYLDHSGSYSTNEVAIYYNSSLYFILSYLLQ